MMGLVDQRIGIQGGSIIDEIVDHGGDSVDAAKAVVERWHGALCDDARPREFSAEIVAADGVFQAESVGVGRSRAASA
jgi:hypothetical protein